MKLPTKGEPAARVMERLRAHRGQDTDWRDGKTLAGVFHADARVEQVAQDAMRLYMWDNALDPRLTPSLLELETQVVHQAASHLHGDASVVGNFTSGGTESVMLAVKTARDWARVHRPQITRPQVVLPLTAHPCFHKAAHYLDVEAVIVPVDPRTLTVTAESMAAAVTDRTILLVGSAPSYAHGIIAPISDLGALAIERGLLLHVDACVGGFLLPLFEELGAQPQQIATGGPEVSWRENVPKPFCFVCRKWRD